MDDDDLALVAPHLSETDVVWLRAEALRHNDVEIPGPSPFDDDASAAADEAELEALVASLGLPRRAHELPYCVRALHRVAVHRVGSGDMRVTTVSGSRCGHGDVLWGGAAFAAELLSSELGARRLLGSELEGLRTLELGAGLGLPSWVCLRQGAKVVATDLRERERIVGLAAGAALNVACGGGGDARVRCHAWGDPPEELVDLHGGYDLVLVCDCLYIVDAHSALAESIRSCLAPHGAALVAFAHHDERNKAAVNGFFDVARATGLLVEPFEERQMPVRCHNMPEWRFFVYAYRLRLAA